MFMKSTYRHFFLMKFLRLALVALALSFIAGCSSQERDAVAFTKVKNGMTEAQITAVLGEPEKIENSADFVVWNYPSGMVFFRNGTVYSWTEGPRRP